MRAPLLVAVLVIFFGQVDCNLKCYQCDSNTSYQDCDREDKRTDTTCDVATHRCIKVDVEYTLHGQDVHNFRKTCVKRENCDPKNNALCKTAGLGSNKKCKTYCCSTSLCNGAGGSIVSSINIVSCVVGLLVAKLVLL